MGGNTNTWVYGYDNANEMTKAMLLQYNPATYGTGDPVLKEVDFKYDVFGNMAERDDYPTGGGNPTVTRYAVDGWNPKLADSTGNTRFNVWAELDGNNNLLTRYLHGDQPDQLFARQDSLVAYWYVTDQQQSVRDVLDNSGTIKDAINYDAWGNISSETNSTYRGNYTWTGRQWDVETNLQYNRARWYDPATGRWQTQDPLGFGAGDSNVYRYVANRPTYATDPAGLQDPRPSPLRDKNGNWLGAGPDPALQPRSNALRDAQGNWLPATPDPKRSSQGQPNGGWGVTPWGWAKRTGGPFPPYRPKHPTRTQQPWPMIKNDWEMGDRTVRDWCKRYIELNGDPYEPHPHTHEEPPKI